MKRGSVTRAFVCGATAAMFSALIQLSAFALSANIQFSDPSTKVGEEFTVSMHVQGDGAIATTEIALGYDSEKMEFERRQRERQWRRNQCQEQRQ